MEANGRHHSPGNFPSGKHLSTHQQKGWVDPRAGSMWRFKNIDTPATNWTPVIYKVFSNLTECSTGVMVEENTTVNVPLFPSSMPWKHICTTVHNILFDTVKVIAVIHPQVVTHRSAKVEVDDKKGSKINIISRTEDCHGIGGGWSHFSVISSGKLFFQRSWAFSFDHRRIKIHLPYKILHILTVNIGSMLKI